MEQNLRLVMAKSVVGLLHAGVDPDEIARTGGLYGVRHRRSGWSSGLTILTAMANVSDHLEGDERIAPLYHGLVHVARDCAGQPSKFSIQPLAARNIPLASLKRWFRNLVESRDPDGAERCLLTAIRQGATDAELADLMGSAATDHFYLDGGHVVDSVNKAFELLDRIGWEHATEILPSLVRQLCGSQRSEEQNAWRSPVDLVSLLNEVFEEIPAILKTGEGKKWTRSDGFIEVLLGEDPHASVLHTFTYANALHQLLKRADTSEMLRGVFHGAARVYLDRFLNIPSARFPSENGKAGGRQADTFREDFLDMLNNQQQTDEAGRMVYKHLISGGDAARIFRTLSEALLREDAEFHSFQMLEAAIRQFGDVEDEEERRIVLVATARYLAAHAPTQREMLQTLRIALRLHRGEPVYEEENA